MILSDRIWILKETEEDISQGIIENLKEFKKKKIFKSWHIIPYQQNPIKIWTEISLILMDTLETLHELNIQFRVF